MICPGCNNGPYARDCQTCGGAGELPDAPESKVMPAGILNQPLPVAESEPLTLETLESAIESVYNQGRDEKSEI